MNTYTDMHVLVDSNIEINLWTDVDGFVYLRFGGLKHRLTISGHSDQLLDLFSLAADMVMEAEEVEA
jgi:hypothetical protein